MFAHPLILSALLLASPVARDSSSPPAAIALPMTAVATTTTPALTAWPTDPLPPGISSTDVVSAVVRVGLDADAVAAAGLSVEDAATLVANTAQALVDAKPAITLADADVMATRAVALPLERKLVAGTANESDLAAWPAAKAAMDSAIAQRDSMLDALFANLATPFGNEKLLVATAIRTQAAIWRDVPAPYRATVRAEADMLALREALAAERIALRNEEEVPQEVAQLLAGVRAEPAIASAITAWQTNAPTIKATWAAQSTLPPGP